MNNDEEFKFAIDRVRTRYSKPEIIESLRQFSKQNGKTLAMRDYDAWRERILCADTIYRRFGGWGKALQAAGLRAERNRTLDIKEMVAAFKACWKKHEAVPSKRQLEAFLEENHCPFRWKSFINIWGGLQALARLVVEVEHGRLAESVLTQRPPSSRARRPISLKDRTAILKRDQYQCVKCGASPKIDKAVRLEVDHIVPVTRGGTNAPENLQTLCLECNQGKKDKED